MTNPDLTPEQLAKARAIALQARHDGHSDAEIDEYLRGETGLGLKQVLSPTVRDYLRAAGMGLTFGFEDELAGIGAALTPGGKGYTAARDEVRGNYDNALKVAPKRMIAAEIVGSLPTALATGGLGEVAEGASAVQKLAHAAKIAGALGAISGAGHSEEKTVGGVAKDAAIGGALSAGIGGTLSAGGSIMGGAARTLRDALNPTGAIMRSAAKVMPANAPETLARQEQIAPGTGVLADQSPGTLGIMKGIGADGPTGVAAGEQSAARLQALKNAKTTIQATYESLQRELPVDDELRAILKRANESAQGDKVDFLRLQRIRTDLREDMQASKRGSTKAELGDVYSDLTRWMTGHVSDLSKVDSDYKFLLQRIKAAQLLSQRVNASTDAYAGNEAFGVTPGSVGASLPKDMSGFWNKVGELFTPDRAVRAKAASNVLLAPGDEAAQHLREIMRLRSGLLAPESPLLRYLQRGVNGALLPNAYPSARSLFNR
jgi:hypothetical protein